MGTRGAAREESYLDVCVVGDRLHDEIGLCSENTLFKDVINAGGTA